MPPVRALGVTLPSGNLLPGRPPSPSPVPMPGYEGPLRRAISRPCNPASDLGLPLLGQPLTGPPGNDLDGASGTGTSSHAPAARRLRPLLVQVGMKPCVFQVLKPGQEGVSEDGAPGFATPRHVSLICPRLFLNSGRWAAGSEPSLTSVSLWGPWNSRAWCPLGACITPGRASKPHDSPSNRHCSVGRSNSTTNYFVLREGQKGKGS